MVLGENERPAAPGDGIAIALLDGARGFLAGEGEVLFIDGQIGAGKQANEVHGIGGGPSFIEIVDAPDEAALEVAPGAEIFDVQIADGENLGSAGEFGADDGPQLRPAIEGSAEEGKSVESHVAVLQSNVRTDEPDVARGPFFKVGGGVDDVGKSEFVWVHENAQRRWAGASFAHRSLLREGNSHKKRGDLWRVVRRRPLQKAAGTKARETQEKSRRARGIALRYKGRTQE